MTVLLFIETSREFGRSLLHGIAKYSRLHGHWRVYRRPVALDSSLPDWRDMRIDGAIARDVQVAQVLGFSLDHDDRGKPAVNHTKTNNELAFAQMMCYNASIEMSKKRFVPGANAMSTTGGVRRTNNSVTPGRRRTRLISCQPGSPGVSA